MIDPRKRYRLEFTLERDYLRADVSGEEDSVAISAAYWAEIAHRCRETGSTRLLVVEDIAQPATLGETVQVVDALVSLGFRDIRIAYVDLREASVLLGQTEFLAARAGLVGRVFREVAPAIEWLLADRGAGSEAREARRA
jgi:hypothetical protein